jgi:ligand-binding sensor domain-containing protein
MTNKFVFNLLLTLIFSSACNSPVKKDIPTTKEHPKLIKTIGDPKYGNVNCSLQDKDGNLWFGTTENGLYKYDGKAFKQYLVADGLNSNAINDMLQDKNGKIWIGTKGGICVFDGKMFTEIKIKLPKNLPPNTNKYYQTHSVYNIIQDHSGKIWFVTIDGVYVYDGKSFTPFIIDETANGFLTSNDKVERIFEDKSGNIWFGGRTNGGVYRYDGKSITNLKLPTLYQNGPTPKPHNWAWPQVQDKNGNIWFSNWGGAYRYDGKSFTSFTKSDGLTGDGITRIIEDKTDNLWFGGNVLSRYDGKSFSPFTTKDGLTNVGVWSILQDTSGNIWIGTRQTGLYLYNGKTFITYSEYKH